MMDKKKTLSIIIVSYNTGDLLRKCLEAVSHSIENIETDVFVVDNNSHDDSVQIVKKEFPEYCLIRNARNSGFAAANNNAIKRSHSHYVLLLNSDAFLNEDALVKTIDYMEHNRECGVLGVQLLNKDGSFQPSARQFPSSYYKIKALSGISAKFPQSKLLGGPTYSWWDHKSVKEVDWVPGAFFLINSQLIDDIGMLDDRYFLYYEETDFCLRAKKAGWKTVYYPYASVLHLCGESSKTKGEMMSESGKQLINIRIESEQKYYWKNYGLSKMLIDSFSEILLSGLICLKNVFFWKRKKKTVIYNYTIIKLQMSSLLNRRYKRLTPVGLHHS